MNPRRRSVLRLLGCDGRGRAEGSLRGNAEVRQLFERAADRSCSAALPFERQVIHLAIL